MDPILKVSFPHLVEHTIYLPWAIKDENAVAEPLEEFCRDFDEHVLQQLDPPCPWLRDAFEEANGFSDDEDYDEDEMAAGILRAIQQGKADGWLVKIRIPVPPKDTWGHARPIWAYGSTVQHAIGTALAHATELRARERAKVKA